MSDVYFKSRQRRDTIDHSRTQRMTLSNGLCIALRILQRRYKERDGERERERDREREREKERFFLLHQKNK